MKARLVLKVIPAEDEQIDLGGYLMLNLILDSGHTYNMLPDWSTIGIEINNDNVENYFSTLETAINEASILLNAIPGLKFIVDQSVVEFIDGSEEEVKKFVNQLTIEI